MCNYLLHRCLQYIAARISTQQALRRRRSVCFGCAVARACSRAVHDAWAAGLIRSCELEGSSCRRARFVRYAAPVCPYGPESHMSTLLLLLCGAASRRAGPELDLVQSGALPCFNQASCPLAPCCRARSHLRPDVPRNVCVRCFQCGLGGSRPTCRAARKLEGVACAFRLWTPERNVSQHCSRLF